MALSQGRMKMAYRRYSATPLSAVVSLEQEVLPHAYTEEG